MGDADTPPPADYSHLLRPRGRRPGGGGILASVGSQRDTYYPPRAAEEGHGADVLLGTALCVGLEDGDINNTVPNHPTDIRSDHDSDNREIGPAVNHETDEPADNDVAVVQEVNRDVVVQEVNHDEVVPAVNTAQGSSDIITLVPPHYNNQRHAFSMCSSTHASSIANESHQQNDGVLRGVQSAYATIHPPSLQTHDVIAPTIDPPSRQTHDVIAPTIYPPSRQTHDVIAPTLSDDVIALTPSDDMTRGDATCHSETSSLELDPVTEETQQPDAAEIFQPPHPRGGHSDIHVLSAIAATEPASLKVKQRRTLFDKAAVKSESWSMATGISKALQKQPNKKARGHKRKLANHAETGAAATTTTTTSVAASPAVGEEGETNEYDHLHFSYLRQRRSVGERLSQIWAGRKDTGSGGGGCTRCVLGLSAAVLLLLLVVCVMAAALGLCYTTRCPFIDSDVQDMGTSHSYQGTTQFSSAASELTEIVTKSVTTEYDVTGGVQWSGDTNETTTTTNTTTTVPTTDNNSSLT